MEKAKKAKKKTPETKRQHVGDKAFVFPDIEVRLARTKNDGAWYDVVAVGRGDLVVTLAGFRAKRPALHCRKLILDVIDDCIWQKTTG